MLDINSRLYEILTVVIEIIIVSFICYVIAIPIITLPFATYIYCLLCGNVTGCRKLFYFGKVSRKRVVRILIFLAVGLCSLYSSLYLIQSKDFFLSRLVLSILVAFNVAAGILVVERSMTFLETYRSAFFYSAGFFYKSVLPVFVYLMLMSKLNGMLPVYVVLLMTCLFCYVIFRWNYKTILKTYHNLPKND